MIKDVLKDPHKVKYYYKKAGEVGLQLMQKEKVLNIQDEFIKSKVNLDVQKLIVFLVPGWNGVNGGVMSICSIAKVSKEIMENEGWQILLMTLPDHLPFSKYTGFENSFDVYRFEQLRTSFNKLEELILHIPENFVIDFQEKISVKDEEYLGRIKKIQINILNQNTWYMPEARFVDNLRKYTNNITITVAHKKYCNKSLRDRYNASVHFFSTSNLTNYSYKSYEEKEELLLTSIDNNPFKEAIISKIVKDCPNLKIKQIENMTYEEYKGWISKAKWMITFGEGIDGYFVESIRSGAISFAVYNPDFFSSTFDNLENIYESYQQMLSKISDDIKRLDNLDSYSALSHQLIALDKIEYNDQAYKDNIEAFYKREYTFPHPGLYELKKMREIRLEQMPLISIVMAVYNGEKYLLEQLESIKKLTYSNIELIISDDGSSDNSINIIKKFSKKYPLKLVVNSNKKGVNGNFENALSYAKGEFIAFCDQDDKWKPGKLEVLLNSIDDYDIIHSAVELIDDEGNPHPNNRLVSEYSVDHSDKREFIDYITAGWVLGCTSLVRKRLIEKALPFPEKIFFHDWWMSFVAIKHGEGITYTTIPTIQYRQHSNNTAQAAFADINWYKKKIQFNLFLGQFFEKDLYKNEAVALMNNTNYCASKYFLLADHNGYYNDVDQFIEENKELFNRYYFRKFVEIVAQDVLLENGLDNGKNVSLREFIQRRFKDKIKNPSTKNDQLLANLYFKMIKPLFVEPYRKIKKIY
jgi:glycosyltransferase involved in cell wall biosynthesis